MQQPNRDDVAADLVDDLIVATLWIFGMLLKFKLRMAELDKRERPKNEAA